jgi:ubiquinone/menaquinone biosynthesis C-methylase UbiE
MTVLSAVQRARRRNVGSALRKQAEAAFHDRRARDRADGDARSFERSYPNLKHYVVTRAHSDAMLRWVREHCGPGRVALDLCCGEGAWARLIAATGATTYGVDLSEASLAGARAAAAGQPNPPTFRVMDAEALDFPDQTFDVIVASGCLHHVDLDRVYGELRRVLKPGGRIMCNEALAHNPLFQWYRRRTPHLRTAWEATHILRVEDIHRAERYFARIDVRFYYFFSLVAVPLRRSWLFEPFLGALERLDRALLAIPGVRRLAWQTTFELSSPREQA